MISLTKQCSSHSRGAIARKKWKKMGALKTAQSGGYTGKEHFFNYMPIRPAAAIQAQRVLPDCIVTRSVSSFTSLGKSRITAVSSLSSTVRNAILGRVDIHNE
jgi:hypothetical protein